MIKTHLLPFRLMLLFALLILAAALRAQEAPAAQAGPGLLDPGRFAVALKYTGLSYHPGGGENEEPYKRSLDDRDTWVVLLGLQADADYMPFKYADGPLTRFSRFFFLRFSTSLYRDCADVWAGYFHLSPRLDVPIGRVSMRIGVGPTLLWRQNWLGKVKGYTKDSFFGPATQGDFQSKYISYGGDIEAEWRAWDKVALVYSIIPGFPEVVQSSIGLRKTF